MFDRIIEKIADKAADGVKASLAPVGPYLRMLVTGTLLVLTSIVFWALTILFLALSLFFAVANLPYVAAALYVSLAGGILGILVLAIGLRMLRKPR